MRVVVVTPASSAALSAEARKKILQNFNEAYDADNGGWGDIHKFIDADSMDYLVRDAYHTGVKIGLFDLDFLIRNLRLHEQDGVGATRV